LRQKGARKDNTFGKGREVYKRGMIRLGYPTQNLAIPAWTNRTCRLASLHDAEKVQALTLLQSSDRLINREDPQVGRIIQPILKEEGIDVRLGRRVEKARKEDGGTVVTLDDGEEVKTDVVVMVAGRTPRTEGIGLDSLGVEADDTGIPVDDRCRITRTDGLWAVGDVTGTALFTHVAQYQGRIVAANILGGDRRTDYKGIPRMVFSYPEIAAAGLTEEESREQGMDVASINLELPKALAQSVTYEKEPRGNLGLVVDRDERVLVGAWAVAPLAGEWIHQACLAIKAGISVDTLLDSIFQFPTFSPA
jgi:pyruvate/2-oxoglutarate dehydrogenase complex dihydrolipoamide dehydrogenase (E3) component